MSKLAKEQISVSLTGDGADEIFGGYSRYYGMSEKNLTRFVPKPVFKPIFAYIIKFYNFIPSHKLQIILSYLNLSRTKEDRFFRSILSVPDIDKSKMVPFKIENIENTIKGKFIKNLDIKYFRIMNINVLL